MVANLSIARANRVQRLVHRPLVKNVNGQRVQGASFLSHILKGAGIQNEPSVPPQYSILHQGQALLNTASRYNFSFSSNDTLANSSYPTHRLLNLQDAFVVIGMAVHLSRRVSTAPGQEQFFSWAHPDAAIFGTQAPNLESVYNGVISYTQDQTVVLENIPMRQFRAVPISQQGAAASRGAAAPYADSYNQDMVMFDLPQAVVVLGNNKNQFFIDFPANSNIASAVANTTNVLEFTLYGFRITNVLIQR
ncbi:MAG: hypothetical protein ACK5XP_07965 [Sphingobacteriia bacterium]|jgi:hypothetical protein